jgi:hypothetical protein
MEGRALLANIIATGILTSTADDSKFDYSIELSNSSSSNAGIGTFWYAWEPGGDLLQTSPTAVTAPTWLDRLDHAFSVRRLRRLRH